MTITVGSLFAGIDGMDLGLERAGMSVKWQVEIDPWCRRVLAKHWPDVERFEDVREVGQHNLAPVDLICGGFPCQDLSVAGKREGLTGERSGLYWQLVRIASELRPKWLVLENVPGLLSSHDGRDFALVLGGCTGVVPEIPVDGWGTSGVCVGRADRWSIAWRVLDAQFFGVAQRRRRVFLVGHPDPGRAAAVLFEPESGARDSQAVRKAGSDVAYALDAGAGGISGKEQQRTLVPITIYGNRPNERRSAKSIDVAGPITCAARTTSNSDQDYVVAFNWQSGGKGFDGVGNKPTALQCGQTPAVAGPAFDPDRMRAVSGLSGSLDVFACETCAGGPDGPRYRGIGNSVVRQVAEWIGRRIVENA